MRVSERRGSNNNTWVPSESRIFSENWVIEWSYAAFSLLFNVYIRSMNVKLLQTTFSDSHRLHLRVLGASIVFEVSPNFPIYPFSSSVRHCSHLLPFLGNNVWWDPVVAYATELSTWSTPCMRDSEPVLGQEAGDRFRIFALVFDASRKYSYYVLPELNLSLSSHTTLLALYNQWLSLRLLSLSGYH